MTFPATHNLPVLQVGWPGGALLTETEQRAHFGVWAILKAPLIFGNDLR